MANMGDAMRMSLAESFKSMDPVGFMRKIVAETPDDEEGRQIKEKLGGVLKEYEKMSDEERESFVNHLRAMVANKVFAKYGDNNGGSNSNIDIDMDGLQEEIREANMQRLLFLVVAVLTLVILFVFFGWKLYKSIKEKAIKREEKKKQKEMKKE